MKFLMKDFLIVKKNKTKDVDPYKLTTDNQIIIGGDLKHPFIVNRLVGQSGMSYGALGKMQLLHCRKVWAEAVHG